MGIRVSMPMFEAKLTKAYKTFVKHTILDLGHALLTHHEAPRIHKPHECHLESSREHLGASCGPSGSHLGAIWGARGSFPGPHRSHLGAIWGSCGSFPGPHGSLLAFPKKCSGRTIQQHPQRLTIQPQVIILQPGLAECAKPLK